MNEKDLRSLKKVHMSKAAKARIAARLDGECSRRSTHPAEETFAEPETCHAEKSGGWDWLHGVGTAVAACLVVAVSAGMILAVQRHQPPLAPGNAVEQQAACRVPMYTPFGDILEADLLFQYPTEYTRKAAQDMQDKGISDFQMMEERTLQTELKQSLAEVFRVYGWREQANNTNPEATITDDCIVMHIYRTTERNSDDVTAYFQFDGDGQHFVRVDADGETKWYDLDEEIIRCLRSIIIEQTAAEYQPPERGFADVMSRINDVRDDAGNPFNLTDGQEAALSTLLNRSVLYAWNTLREPDPQHGRYIRLQLMEPTEAGKPQTYGTMTFWLDSGCLTYEVSETYHGSGDDVIVSSSVHSYQDYWVDDGAFMEDAEQLLRDGMYPGCPVGNLMEVELSADPEPSGLNEDTWKEQLSAYLNSLTWLEIPCPVDGREQYKQLELVYVRDDKKYALTFYPEMYFMEWTEEHEKYTFVSEDHTQSHIVSHYFAMPPDVWENVQAIMESGTAESAQPFMNLLLSSYLITFQNEQTECFPEEYRSKLPEEKVKYTADLFRVQDLFDELSWQEITPIDNQDHITGMIWVNLSGSQRLCFGMDANNDGKCLCFYENLNQIHYYYTTQEQINTLLEILSETQNPQKCDEPGADIEIVSIASDYLRNNAPSVIDTILWGETEVTQLSKLPENYVPVAMLEWKSGEELTGDFWLVRFHTTQDALLGTEDVYLTEDGIVIGLGIRE